MFHYDLGFSTSLLPSFVANYDIIIYHFIVLLVTKNIPYIEYV